jgi:hypothetical protein
VLALAVAALFVAALQGEPAPTPSVVPVTWELDFKYQDPQPIAVTLPDGSKKTFWYMLYTVANRTGADRTFIPDFTLYTDTGRIYRSGVAVPAVVFDAIQKNVNNPLLVDQTSITGKILQGEDNAKDGVAIWPDIDPEARAFDSFIGGLSGEEAKIALPASQPGAASTKVILRKALRLQYAMPSEPAARAANPPKLVDKSWVMR